MKKCSACHEFKDESAFSRSKSRPDGLCSQCKLCQAAYRVTPEAQAVRAQYREKNRTRIRRYGVVFRAKHHEALCIKFAARRVTHHEKIQSGIQSWRMAHPEIVRKYQQKWASANKEKCRIALIRRRARKRGLPDTFTQEQWHFALTYFDHSCAVCGNQEGFFWTLAMDHWIPMANPDCPGTIATNIVPLCHGQGGCNNSKCNKDPHAWLLKKYGKAKTAKIEARIAAYFALVAERGTA